MSILYSRLACSLVFVSCVIISRDTGQYANATMAERGGVRVGGGVYGSYNTNADWWDILLPMA